MVYVWSSAAVYIEWDAEILEWFLDEIMISVNHLLCCDTLLTSSNGYRYSVFVATSDEDNILLF